jgi:hypothetical protein
MENALLGKASPSCGCGELQQRLEALESRVEDVELVVAGLVPVSRRPSKSIVSWLRTQLQRHCKTSGSKIISD